MAIEDRVGYIARPCLQNNLHIYRIECILAHILCNDLLRIFLVVQLKHLSFLCDGNIQLLLAIWFIGSSINHPSAEQAELSLSVFRMFWSVPTALSSMLLQRFWLGAFLVQDFAHVREASILNSTKPCLWILIACQFKYPHEVQIQLEFRKYIFIKNKLFLFTYNDLISFKLLSLYVYIQGLVWVYVWGACMCMSCRCMLYWGECGGQRWTLWCSSGAVYLL